MSSSTSVNSRRQWIEQLIEAIDQKDAARFASYFADEGTFRIGNQPVVKGKNSVQQYVSDFFQLLRSCTHDIVALHESDNCITWQGRVTYVRQLDGRSVQVPFCNFIRVAEGKVQENIVYVDTSPLFAP